MQRVRPLQRWLTVGLFSVGLALVMAFGVPTLMASNGTGVVVAQSDDDEDDDNRNDNSSMPTPIPSPQTRPAASPVPSGTGSGTGTSSGTSTSSSQTLTSSDPDRGGIEMPGQPACYKPAKNVTERRMYNESRPACFGEQQ